MGWVTVYLYACILHTFYAIGIRICIAQSDKSVTIIISNSNKHFYYLCEKPLLSLYYYFFVFPDNKIKISVDRNEWQNQSLWSLAFSFSVHILCYFSHIHHCHYHYLSYIEWMLGAYSKHT